MKTLKAEGAEVNYCGKCGKEIKESYENALKNAGSEHFKKHSLCRNCGRVRDPQDNGCTKCGKKYSAR